MMTSGFPVTEVVGEALRLHDERDRLREIGHNELRRQIQAGLDSADDGDVLDGPRVLNSLCAKVKVSRGRDR